MRRPRCAHSAHSVQSQRSPSVSQSRLEECHADEPTSAAVAVLVLLVLLLRGWFLRLRGGAHPLQELRKCMPVVEHQVPCAQMAGQKVSDRSTNGRRDDTNMEGKRSGQKYQTDRRCFK